MSNWTPYEPNEARPWDLRRVVHLHRRTVFGASWGDVQRDLADGPHAAVTRVLEGGCRGAGTPDDFEQLSGVIGQAAVASGNADRLKAWWVYRCLFSPQPLEERLTLMWHNHFATSNLKVQDLQLMRRQNETFRRHAFGPFGNLLAEMTRDPALLVWLDAPSNRKGQPNENLARELMELFTLGIGHYTEEDVKDVARALTGRTVRHGEFSEQPDFHDDGDKTILGQTGPWTGDDVVRLLLEHPATSRRIAWRLTGEFFGEGVVDDAALDELASGLREHSLDVRWGVETILRSERFFADENIDNRICDPASFLIAPLRALECWRDPPSTLVLAEWLSRMGLDLFYPPNVGGWPGGRAWLSTRTVIARANYAEALVNGRLSNPASPPPLPDIVSRHMQVTGLQESIRRLSLLLCGLTNEELVSPIDESISEAAGTDSQLSQAVVSLLTRAEAQVH